MYIYIIICSIVYNNSLSYINVGSQLSVVSSIGKQVSLFGVRTQMRFALSLRINPGVYIIIPSLSSPSPLTYYNYYDDNYLCVITPEIMSSSSTSVPRTRRLYYPH